VREEKERERTREREKERVPMSVTNIKRQDPA
jgi:hypothetical protein